MLAALAHQAAITFRGITGDWSMDALVLLGAGGYVLLGIAQGVGFGMLFKNTPAAVVVFFVLPTAWSILGSMVSWLGDAATWLDMNQTMQPLFEGSLTGAQWAHLATSVAVWVVAPLAVGIWRLTRAEVNNGTNPRMWSDGSPNGTCPPTCGEALGGSWRQVLPWLGQGMTEQGCT